MKKRDMDTAIRCAIYTRKSTEEGLDQDFNTLDAQRESAEAYIASQKGEGWVCLPTHYDDGGFTGGNMERPALRRLMNDIEEGRVDCVIVYKVDRLSRSLLDFSRIMETFDKHGVSFVSVTQQFNTTSSMGRLTLNILLSFAQFEREIISERTRDKMAAARRKGKYIGGLPVLGYDVDRKASRLVVNELEAARVREIFGMYLNQESLLKTVDELERRGWMTKQWVTKKGKQRGGNPFTKTSLHKLLTNVTYVGKARYKNEIHEGEHKAIVDTATFEKVQRLLRLNHRTGGARVRNKYGALLKGLLYCGSCGCSMNHTYSAKPGGKRYRYYVCLNAQKRGWHNCPAPSIPAAEIEAFVVDQIRDVAQKPATVKATYHQLRRQVEKRQGSLAREQTIMRADLERYNAEMRMLISAPSGGATPGEQADLLERMQTIERRLTEINEETCSLEGKLLTEQDVAEKLRDFDAVWESLSPREQSRILAVLIERVEYDGEEETVSVVFHESGLASTADELEPEEVLV